MDRERDITLQGYPRNKDKFVRLIKFFKAILGICEEIDIHPVVDGSLAVFAYTKNIDIDVNDIDLSISETVFPRMISILKTKGIEYRLRKWHVLEVVKDDLKIGFGSTEQWSQGLPINYENLHVGNHQVKILGLSGLTKQYRFAMNDRKKKVYEDACEGIKYLDLKKKHKMLMDLTKRPFSKKEKQQITIQKIIMDPFLVASKHALKNGEKVLFRPLVKSDAIAFGRFLENLQEETRTKFGPHPLSIDEAKNICVNLNYSEMLRMILINTTQEIIGYMIFSFLLRESQVLRYQDYKIPVMQGRDACIAPVVADKYQDSGAGSVMLKETIKVATSFGVKYLILWQGVQSTNSRAIHYYKKFGFKKTAEFDRYGTHNVDMTLVLNDN